MPRNERDQTDKSLDEERDRTDAELLARTSKIDDRADAVLRHARERARQLLELARQRADRKLDAVGAGVAERTAVARERATEDAITRKEQDAATKLLEVERAERRMALEFLLEAERKATDEMLRMERVHSDDALAWRDDVLAMVAHDLRGLTNVVGLSAAVIATTADPDNRGSDLEAPMARIVERSHTIQLAMSRMSKLLGDLLDLANLEAGRLACTPSLQPLRPILDELAALFAEPAAQHRVTLHVDAVDPDLAAVCDAERLHQILSNLLLNAFKFTPRGGSVTVSAARADRVVTISVADTGAGSADEHLDRVFDRMWQSDIADRRGIGLGLYIARRLVHAQGGQISARRRAEGGTIVTVSLPSA